MEYDHVNFYIILSGKGGVGKSTISSILATKLSKEPTLILDFDICGPSQSNIFNVKGKLTKHLDGFKPLKIADNLDLISFGNIINEKDSVIWRGPKKEVFLEMMFNSCLIKNNSGFIYKNIVIDMPPGVSDEHSFLNNKIHKYRTLHKFNSFIITTNENISLFGAIKTIEYAKLSDINIMGIINSKEYVKCSCSEKQYIYGKGGAEKLAAEYEIQYLGGLEYKKDLEKIESEGVFYDFVCKNKLFYDVFDKINFN